MNARSFQQTSLENRSILVVEDEQAVASLIRDVLRYLGADVRIVEGGAAAIGAITEKPYDLILLDMVMPGVDGLSVIQYIRKTREELINRVILMTGDQYHCHCLRRLRQLDMPALFKPFDINDLRTIVQDVLTSADRESSLSAA